MSGAPAPRQETGNEAPETFNWKEFRPAWIDEARNSAYMREEHFRDMDETEALMESIAELARAEGRDFRVGVEATEDPESTSLMLEEGLISESQATYMQAHEKARVLKENSPLIRMIEWGKDQGVVTEKEAAKLTEFYSPGVA